MLASKHPALDRQHFLIAEPGTSQITLSFEGKGEIVHCRQGVGMLGSEDPSSLLQHLLMMLT
jgi:hypothetical protein